MILNLMDADSPAAQRKSLRRGSAVLSARERMLVDFGVGGVNSASVAPSIDSATTAPPGVVLLPSLSDRFEVPGIRHSD